MPPGDKIYTLGPWEYLDRGETGPDARPIGWNRPKRTVGCVDLRNRDDMSRDTLGSRPYGFFALPADAKVPDGHELLGTGDARELLTTKDMADKWEGLMGFRPQGDNLIDILWDQMTRGSDSGGIDSVSPLVPRKDGTTRLLLGGHSVVKTVRFGLKSRGRWASVLLAQLRDQFSTTFERNTTLAEKHLFMMVRKYGVDWRMLVEPRLRRHTEGPRDPSTTVNDDLLGDGTGDLDDADWEYESGKNYRRYSGGVGTYAGDDSNRAAAAHLTSFSSDDHYGEIVWVINTVGSCGPAARVGDPTSTTLYDNYHMQRFGGQGYISKVVNGSLTNIANAAVSFSVADVDQIDCNGSDQEIFVNTVTVTSATDTALSGQLQAGFMILSSNQATMKDFEGSDGVSGTGPSRLSLLGVG